MEIGTNVNLTTHIHSLFFLPSIFNFSYQNNTYP